MDEEGTHIRLKEHLRVLIDPTIAAHRGHIVKNTGDGLLVLLRHKCIRGRRAIETRQHGHRGNRLTRASMTCRRTVAIEFGTWRSGRSGGSSGAVTVGYGKLREPRGGTRC